MVVLLSTVFIVMLSIFLMYRPNPGGGTWSTNILGDGAEKCEKSSAGVKRRSCRSMQVNKTQVKSCRSRLASMGLRALGLQPIDVASATVRRSQSQICSITKMPINVVYCEIHCFFESFESWKNSIITGFCNVFVCVFILYMGSLLYKLCENRRRVLGKELLYARILYNKSLKRNLDSQMAKNLDSPHVLSLFSLVSYITLFANYSEIVMSKVLAKILSFVQKYVHNLCITRVSTLPYTVQGG